MQPVTDGSIVIPALTALTTLGCLSFPPDQVIVMEDLCWEAPNPQKSLEVLCYLLRTKDIQLWESSLSIGHKCSWAHLGVKGGKGPGAQKRLREELPS